jgi:hypothetical protein
MLEKDSQEAVDLIHGLVDPAYMEGDLSVPELIMMGHKISAAIKLMRVNIGKPSVSAYQQLGAIKGAVSPGASLFTAGDVIIGDLLYNGCLAKDPFKNLGELGSGDLTAEGVLPLIASAAGAVAKPLLKLVGKTGIGKAIGKGFSKAGGAVKGLFKKKAKVAGEAAKESLGKRAVKGVANVAATGLAAEAAMSGIKQLRSEKGADDAAEAEDLTRSSSMRVVPADLEEVSDPSNTVNMPSSAPSRSDDSSSEVDSSVGAFVIS